MTTFRSLENQLKSTSSVSISSTLSALEMWYERVADTPIDNLPLPDLLRALRQDIFSSYLIKPAIRLLQQDPKCGELRDSELAEAVCKLPPESWKGNEQLQPELASFVRALVEARNSLDEKQLQTLTSWLQRFPSSSEE